LFVMWAKKKTGNREGRRRHGRGFQAEEARKRTKALTVVQATGLREKKKGAN